MHLRLLELITFKTAAYSLTSTTAHSLLALSYSKVEETARKPAHNDEIGVVVSKLTSWNDSVRLSFIKGSRGEIFHYSFLCLEEVRSEKDFQDDAIL